jgi:hypothetical protein
MPRRRANLPRMRLRAARALTLARPAKGNHARQGVRTASARRRFPQADPLTRMVGLRPGRPRMRTLKASFTLARYKKLGPKASEKGGGRRPHVGGLGGSAPQNWTDDPAKVRSTEQGSPKSVETRGIEPLTPALQRQCSAN